MRVLVTGASGFLGSHLVDALITEGHEIKALVRKTSNTCFLSERGIELCYGDITDGNTLLQAVKDSKIVFHCAANVSDWGDPQTFFRVNVTGTENLLKASLEAGVDRFVHASSLTVLDVTKNHWQSDEDHPYPDTFFDSYTETKVLAEKLVKKYHQESSLSACIIRPSIIWGLGDTIVFPRLGRLIKSGKFFFVGKGNQSVSISHVSNVVEALILAGIRKEASGQIYNITDGEVLVFREFIEALAGVLDCDPPRRSIPFALAYPAAFLMELWGKVMRVESPPLFTRYGVYLTSMDAVFAISKAKKELGYEPRISFKKGLKEIGPWLKKTVEGDDGGEWRKGSQSFNS